MVAIFILLAIALTVLVFLLVTRNDNKLSSSSTVIPHVSSSTILPTAGANRTFYVSKGGSDTTGTGSVLLPFLTIPKAMDSIPEDASPTNQYVILVNPGTYTENISLKANVFIEGIQNNICILECAMDVDNETWNNNAVNRSGIISCFLNDSGFNFDFQLRSSTNGRLFVENCRISNGISFTCFSSTNQVRLNNNIFLGNNVTQRGGVSIISNCSFINASQILLIAADGMSTNGLITGGGGNVDVTINWFPGNGTLLVDIVSFGIGRELAVTGTGANVNVSVDSINAPPILGVGANVVYTTLASALRYIVDTPTSWVLPAPSDVNTALNRIANHVATNISPIP